MSDVLTSFTVTSTSDGQFTVSDPGFSDSESVKTDELAALREELAKSNAAHDIAAENHAALNTNIFTLEQRLTAAEQRNSKLERVLAQLLNEDDGLRAAAELSTGFVWCALQRHAESIEAALKPTESGASE